MPDYPLIRGQLPDSWQEVYFAKALDKYRIPYYFQFVINERRGVRGSIVVDFVISRPFYIPVEIFGKYWHEGALGADDRLKLILEQQYFKREVVVIWSDELPDQDTANMYVRQNFA